MNYYPASKIKHVSLLCPHYRVDIIQTFYPGSSVFSQEATVVQEMSRSELAPWRAQSVAICSSPTRHPLRALARATSVEGQVPGKIVGLGYIRKQASLIARSRETRVVLVTVRITSRRGSEGSVPLPNLPCDKPKARDLL